MGIEGKIVAITGGSSGIGRATAKLLAARGAFVVLGARGETALAEAVEEIVAAGGRATSIPIDVSRRADLQALVDLAIARGGSSTRSSTPPVSVLYPASTRCVSMIGMR